MGRGTYRDDDLDARKRRIADSGGDTFAYTSTMRRSSSKDVKCHETLAIDKKRMRESRDSATHPESNALAVIFDVTGSMGQVPVDLEDQLKKLMGYFLKRNYLPSTHILFGAVGDSTCDKVPLQVGEFEPGAQELMDFFQRVYLEGGGGGQNTESYQNALYFLARHTSIDCFEKRGKKGYIFMFGDELPYDKVRSAEIRALMGNTGPQEDVPTVEIIKEVREKYQLFFIIPLGTSNGRDQKIWSTWRALLGEEFVLGMEKTEQVCELIGTVVGTCEGKVNAEEAIKNLRAQNFGDDYLDIAQSALLKLWGINKTKKNTGPSQATQERAKKAKTKKTNLRI